MALEPRRIPFSEFSDDLLRIIELILANNEAIVVENEDGSLISVTPMTSVAKSDVDMAAFLSAAGSWKDFDDKAFLTDNRKSRDMSSRPPVVL